MLEPFDQLEPPPTPPKPKMPLGKVVLVNFGIMLAYMLLFSLLDHGGPEAGLAALIGNAFTLVLQVGINLLAGLILVFSEQRKHVGSALLIGGLITAAIGFGTCLAALSLVG